MSYMRDPCGSLECLQPTVAEATATTRRGRREELVRAANFDRLSSAVLEKALTMPEPLVSAATRPVRRAVGAFDIVLQLWDALRDAVRAVKARAR
jgi:hypothetical protein